MFTPMAAASYSDCRKRSYERPCPSRSTRSGTTPPYGFSTTTTGLPRPNPAAYRQARQVPPDPSHARRTAAPTVLQRRQRDLGLVEVHAVDACVDLQADDGPQVLPPHGVVAVHHVVPVLHPGAFDPQRVARPAVDVPLGTLLQDVPDLPAAGVQDRRREVLLSG